MNKVITRFAPSPTGKLHIGNVRTALINWLYAKQHAGEFILRMDDTDLARSKDEYKKSIMQDLRWLSLEWDSSFNQLSRLERYDQAKRELIEKNRLYPCYETQEELEIKRKFQLSAGKPPIYDRSSLSLSAEQIAKYEKQGRKPHYRFLIKDEEIIWNDLVKGDIRYQGSNLGDPVIIREDGTMTYMLCSTVDDIDYNISHIIRGEDHVSNSAIQIQMFDALGHESPSLAHLSLVKSKDSKISKREGGFEISSLREDYGIEPMTINSFLTFIGSSSPVTPIKEIKELVQRFDISTYSKSPTTYIPEELDLLNHKLIITYEFDDVKQYLHSMGLVELNEKFWLAIRPNLHKLEDVKEWWDICHKPINSGTKDTELMAAAADTLPQSISNDTWSSWTKTISKNTGRKGRELFMPLRLALTGKTTGPELKNLLPLLSRSEILKRLS